MPRKRQGNYGKEQASVKNQNNDNNVVLSGINIDQYDVSLVIKEIGINSFIRSVSQAKINVNAFINNIKNMLISNKNIPSLVDLHISFASAILSPFSPSSNNKNANKCQYLVCTKEPKVFNYKLRFCLEHSWLLELHNNRFKGIQESTPYTSRFPIHCLVVDKTNDDHFTCMVPDLCRIFLEFYSQFSELISFILFNASSKKINWKKNTPEFISQCFPNLL
jgi:hypothetical protein